MTEIITYHDNGCLKQKYSTLNEEIHGSYLEYNSNQTLKSKLMFRNGILHGICFFYIHGKLSQKVKFNNGNKHGWVLNYYDNNFIMLIHYRDDLEDGILLLINSNRTITLKQHYSKGKLHGISYYYDFEGRLIHTENYVANVLHGEQITYNVNGSKTIKIYKNGILVKHTFIGS